MSRQKPDQQHGLRASSAEFSSFDQVQKPDYNLAEGADEPDDFDDEFEFKTCDLGRFLHGDADDRQAFSQELAEAMQGIGFAILEGHGLDPALFVDAAEWVEELFTETSLADKLSFRAARHGAVSEGYFPIRETSEIHPDLVEGWVLGRRAYQLDGLADFDAARFWPRAEYEPRFRSLVQAELPLFLPIMQSILMGLGCEPQLFDARLERPNFGQRLNYYQPLVGDVAASGAGRLLGHEDVDLFTLLPAPTVEGLQVLNRNGKWVRLDAPPGSLVLNTGDYLQRLSNDILPSTTHRVGRPRDPAQAARSRVSFPLAAYLRPDEILEVLPGLPDPHYEPIRVITFHTRTTAKFYGDDYAVEDPLDEQLPGQE
jgi:isopenicillin N synthase-like dioxygenase